MRYLEKVIEKDLQKKMVFIAGPRQCGKTTLAKHILNHTTGVYLNWDDPDHRKEILKRSWHPTQRLVVLDEVHKYKNWKNWLKGTFDTQRELHRFLITGSARLDLFRKGGDSMMGRYHLWHLHPFSLSEIPKKMTKNEAFLRLMKVGGFPEPFLDGDENAARRWRKERVEKILKDDVRDLEPIKDIQTLGLFVDMLRARVGQLVVLSNMAEDLQVAPKTLKHWLNILERMYMVFIVRPYTKNLPRAVQKPPKVYFYDNADVMGGDGARFENLVATHLLKKQNFIEDSLGYRCELHYLRDKEGREVDFVLTKDGSIEELVEAKLDDPALSRSLIYYAQKLKPKLSAKQIVAKITAPKAINNILLESAIDALSNGLV